MRASPILIISSSSTTELPFSVVSEPGVFTDLYCAPAPRPAHGGWMWPAWVEAITEALCACILAWTLNGCRSRLA